MDETPTAGQPSPELTEYIQQRIDELPTEKLSEWLLRVCKEQNVLPLHGTTIYLWALRPDGQILCIDHEAFGHPAEPENNPLTIYAALVHGTQNYPQLGQLIPARPPGLQLCTQCGGAGWLKRSSEMESDSICVRCNGLGWYIPKTPQA